MLSQKYGCRAPRNSATTSRKLCPAQHVAFVCNYRVAIESDCPDEIIRAEFNPEALVRGVQQALGKNEEDDKARELPIA